MRPYTEKYPWGKGVIHHCGGVCTYDFCIALLDQTTWGQEDCLERCSKNKKTIMGTTQKKYSIWNLTFPSINWLFVTTETWHLLYQKEKKATKWGINIAANEGKEKTVIVVVLLFEVIFCEGVISNLDYLIPSLSSLIFCNSLCCQLVQKKQSPGCLLNDCHTYYHSHGQ